MNVNWGIYLFLSWSILSNILFSMQLFVILRGQACSEWQRFDPLQNPPSLEGGDQSS